MNTLSGEENFDPEEYEDDNEGPIQKDARPPERSKSTIGAGSASLEHEVDEDELELSGEDHDDAGETVSESPSVAKALKEVASGDTRQSKIIGASEPPTTPDGSISIADDLPSVKGSILSSPGSSLPASQLSLFRSGQSSFRLPFERRFSARLSPSPRQSPRATSPAFLSPHSRKTSWVPQTVPDQNATDCPEAPWEVVRWTKLKKITGQIFSEMGRRTLGKPTCLAVSVCIAIGTSKGLILVFDYQQTLKSVIGVGTTAVECGTVTSLAISADHSTIAGGHASGHIFTWDLEKPAKPFLHIPPLDRITLADRKFDGHIAGSALLHVGFLGTRHTALVTADDGGMAFSHLATRGLGVVGRAVRTTRILGRYPVAEEVTQQARKRSSVLAFAPLPLGNVEHATDSLGLTALLTPYLLVIVSTTPIAQTQHKSLRPKEMTPHSALSGCLAWFPAVKMKAPAANQSHSVSMPKLVYCWSNVLTVLDVENTEDADVSSEDRQPVLHFRPRSRWRSSEAIVAVQWLTRSVLGVLTISQRLLILEDNSLRMTDASDLIQKHVFHQDLFSKQLQAVVEDLDGDKLRLHGVVADAFYMSFRAYKGRIFLLGFNDVSIGTLSNWADRLLAMMESGDFIGAIDLATAYYNGDTNKLTVGLPDDDMTRHAVVQEKLLGMITASLKYILGRILVANASESSESPLKQLVSVSFTACISMHELDFLFESVYEPMEEASVDSVFFDALEPYILEGEITAIPPAVLQNLISYYTTKGLAMRLEDMLCQLDTRNMDIHQVTTLCREHSLYDAFIYVWSQALSDYVTPLVELLSLTRAIHERGSLGHTTPEKHLNAAAKLYPYLALSLTGRQYPSGDLLPEPEALKAKTDVYGFVFAGKAIEWPKDSGNIFKLVTDEDVEPAFPYLRALLHFDAGSFMSMMNEAFEDNFLNGTTEKPADGVITNGSTGPFNHSLPPTRQYILSVLLEVMFSGDFQPEDTIYLDIFVARNLPKFPQFILLPGTALRKVLVDLCNYPSEDLADDCQLSVEYLLSMHRPPDLLSLVPLFDEAGFYRVLKSVYRGERRFADLLRVHFKDVEDRDAVFDCIADCLRPSSGLTKKQMDEVHSVIVRYSPELASIDAKRMAQTLQAYAPRLVQVALDRLEEGSQAQFNFLRALFEPAPSATPDSQQWLDPANPALVARYVRLMCKFDPSHVADYVGLLRSGDLKLGEVLPAMEQSGVIDAAVVLMAREGLVRDAMERLVRHIKTLQLALTGLIDAAAESPDVRSTEETAQDLVDAFQKYCQVGIWLCRGQSQGHTQTTTEVMIKRNRSNVVAEEVLASHEVLWLDLVDAVVSITRNVTAATENASSAASNALIKLDFTRHNERLRAMVQQSFTALLAFTATESKTNEPRTSDHAHPTFLRILRAFLTRASRASPSMSDLRVVLADIFSAYTFEETILSLANEFLDKDLFVHVEEVKGLRERGWRPKGQVCEHCGKKVWGLGAGGDIWDAWEKKRDIDKSRRLKTHIERAGGDAARTLQRGKGRALSESKAGTKAAAKISSHSNDEANQEVVGLTDSLGSLVIFACRHMCHRRCLEQVLERDGDRRGGRFTVPMPLRCPFCG